MNLKDEILKLLPYWFKREESKTIKFLSVFEKIISDYVKTVEFARDTSELNTFNNRDYVLQKVILKKFEYIKVNNSEIVECYTDKELIKAYEKGEKTYFFDKIHNILYLSNILNNDIIEINGMDYTNKLCEHRVWNADILDEFGLELELPRIEGENNKDYKARLISFSKLLPNSSKYGLSSLIGHTFGLQRKLIMVDGGSTIRIKSNDTICRNIFIDNKPYTRINIESKNSIVIIGDEKYKGIEREITYFEGFDLYNLHEINFENLINEDNTPNKELIDLFKKISIKAPIMWGYARWGEMNFVDDISSNELVKLNPTFDPDLAILRKE